MTGVILEAKRHEDHILLVVQQNDGEPVTLRIDRNALGADPDLLPGHRVEWDGERLEFLDRENAAPLFSLGQVVATPGAITALQASGQTPATFLIRHVAGDWGEVNDEDKRLNDIALRSGERLLSAYLTANGTRIWAITEANRSSTCLLLPEEY